MGASHAAVGLGASSAMGALTTLLTGYNGMDSDHASAAAFIIITVIGGVGAVLHNIWPKLFTGAAQ